MKVLTTQWIVTFNDDDIKQIRHDGDLSIGRRS